MENKSPEGTGAWELPRGGEPYQTSALNGNILRLAVTRSGFQVPGSFSAFLFSLSEVARLLWSLHQRGIVHRDLTSDHILLSDSSVTLLGFLPPPEARSSSVDAALIGTPGYAPPEQVRGEELFEPKSDVFSLGAVLYEALTNQVPFQGAGLNLKLETLTKEPPPIQKQSPACPPSLIELCEMMLSKDAALRPSAEEVQQRLLEIAKEHTKLHILLFSGKRAPITSPTPPKTEQEKFTSEELINRLLPLRPPPPKLGYLDTRSPGVAQPTAAKGRYFIEHEVGQGGIGRVSQAHDQRLQRPVAIKELLNPDNIDTKERFLREALLTARLQHPAIVPIYDVGVKSSGEIFYSMRLISGRPLNELVEDKPFYERLSMLPNVLTVAEAIAYAHTQKIIHRDLKPQNILIGEFGETFVIDWGSAKDLTERETPKKRTPRNQIEVLAAQEASKASDLTLEGSIIGTPAYMPPEQAKGAAVNETADVFALGAILYHVLAGKAPVRNKEKLIEEVQEGVFAPLIEIEPQTPQELLDIVQKAMSKDPKARYTTALSFADELRKYQRGQMIDAHKYTLSERFFRYVKKHKQAFGVGAMAVVLMTAGGAYGVQRIIQERNVAQNEKSAAQQSLNNLILLQARNELESNPAKSLAWIKKLPPDFKDMDKARIIASDAIRRGVPAFASSSSRINEIAYSPNHDELATAEADGSIQLWDPIDRKPKRSLPAKSAVIQFEYSADGSLIVGTYQDSTTRVWSTTKEEPPVEFAHAGFIAFSTLSPDNKYLATVGGDGVTYLWDLATKQKEEIFHSSNGVYNLQFSPDGKTLAAAFWFSETDSEVRLYNLEDRSTQSLSLPNEQHLLVVRFSPTGKHLAASGYGGDLYLWDLSIGEAKKLEGHTATVNELLFSPDGTKLASAGQDKKIFLWDTLTGERTGTYQEHKGGIQDLTFSHNGKYLASASADKTIQLWDLSNNNHRILKRHEDIVVSLVFSPDDSHLISGGYDSLLAFWEVEPSDRKLLFQQKSPVYGLAISPDGAWVAAQKYGKISLWSTSSYEEQELGALPQMVTSITFSATQESLAVGDENGSITIFNLKNKTSNTITPHQSIIQQIKFINDSTIISCGNDSIIKISYLNSKKETTFAGHKYAVSSFIVTPDEKIISTGEDKTIKIWDIKKKSLVKTIPLDTVGFALSLSKDGQYLALAAASSSVRVWRLADFFSGSEPLLLEGHNDNVTKVEFIGASHLLISTSSDATLKLWDASNHESSTMLGHIGGVLGLAVARDVKIAVSSGLDGSVWVWKENVPEETPQFLQWLQKTPSATLTDNISH